MKTFWLTLSFILALPAWASSPAEPTPAPDSTANPVVCRDLLRSPYEISFIKLLADGQLAGFISASDIERVEQSISAPLGEILNPLAGKSLNSKSLAIKHSLDLLIKSKKLSRDNLRPALKELIAQFHLNQVTKDAVKTMTQEVFSPHVVRKIPIGGNMVTLTPSFYSTKDGRDLLGFSNSEMFFSFINIKDQKVTQIPIDGAPATTPEFFSMNGHEMIAAGGGDGYFYRSNLNGPPKAEAVQWDDSHSIKYLSFIKAAHESVLATIDGDHMQKRIMLKGLETDEPALFFNIPKPSKSDQIYSADDTLSVASFFTTQAGRDMVAVPTTRFLYLFDLRKMRNPLTKYFYRPTKITLPDGGDANYFVDKDGHDKLVVLSTYDGPYLIDLADPQNPKPIAQGRTHAVPMKGYFTYTRVITTQTGEHFLITIDRGDLVVKNLDTDSPALEYRTDTDFTPEYFRNRDGNMIMAFVAPDHNLYIKDLSNSSEPTLVETGRNISSSPRFITTQEGRQMIAVGTTDSYIELIDLYGTPAQGEISH